MYQAFGYDGKDCKGNFLVLTDGCTKFEDKFLSRYNETSFGVSSEETCNKQNDFVSTVGLCVNIGNRSVTISDQPSSLGEINNVNFYLLIMMAMIGLFIVKK